ncbi:retropepsin-like aspartic protease [Ancylomarina longa]|uniref:Clan AA aspartic protease n=1 Tax=Ancylomarina longa TaxID=2487017 RepID=A0A434AG81_9BACT|nr:retropepsin-like aspartic protease [Ancylomarina longa]RUT73406.1 hypothetical protein DLK05_13640 [Ancylomarina longa]
MKIEVPFEIIELEHNSFHLLIKCQINYTQFGDLVIDTGASKTVFDLNFVNEYKVIPKEDSEIQSRGLGEGSIDTEIVRIENFQLGELAVNNFTCALIDLTNINEMYHQYCQRKICGLLGSDFLLSHKAIINYETEILQLELF